MVLRYLQPCLSFSEGPLTSILLFFKASSPRAQRTPLQSAASRGNLTLVKLFIEVYHADDSLIAPDGQLALRLAAENGHREVTNYLPLRRGGGWRRWKNHHAKAMERIKKAVSNIYTFFKFFIWDLPKFFLWDVPKHLIFFPAKKALVWAWKHRRHFLPWCKKQAQEMPGRIKRAGKWTWQKIKAVPKAVAKAGKDTWHFCTQTLPKLLKQLLQWLVSLITERIPNTIRIVTLWLWNGFKRIGQWTADVLLKAVSLLHSIFEAVISFFRTLTLKDIWDGLCDLLHTIFVTFPARLWPWILKFGETSYKVMKTLFGSVGELIWHIGWALGWVALYVPKKILIIFTSLGDSIAKAWQEIMVWVNPKR